MLETSERSASEVQQLATTIQAEVGDVAAAIKAAAEVAAAEARTGTTVVVALNTLRQDMSALSEGSERILLAAFDAERAAIEAQRGAELVARRG